MLNWFARTDGDCLYFSVLSVGEIRRGIERLTDEGRRLTLTGWLESELLPWFGSRLLLVDLAIAECWGWLLAQAERPLPSIDSLLAATAITHDLALVTRNVVDFNLPSIKVVNPWNEHSAE